MSIQKCIKSGLFKSNKLFYNTILHFDSATRTACVQTMVMLVIKEMTADIKYIKYDFK